MVNMLIRKENLQMDEAKVKLIACARVCPQRNLDNASSTIRFQDNRYCSLLTSFKQSFKAVKKNCWSSI